MTLSTPVLRGGAAGSPVPVEAIARGYLIGSGWKDYQRTGRVSGIALPDGLRQAQRLPQPIFTPSTKAAVGDHDENVSFAAVVDHIGADLAMQVRDATLAIYRFAAAYAAAATERTSCCRSGRLAKRQKPGGPASRPKAMTLDPAASRNSNQRRSIRSDSQPKGTCISTLPRVKAESSSAASRSS